MPVAPIKQRIPVNATSDANGNITFTFPTVHVGDTLVGSVSIANVSPMSQWTAQVAGTTIANWSGGSTYSQLPIPGGEALVVVGSHVAASTAYQAVLVGLQYPTAEAPALIPGALPVTAPPTTNQQGTNGQTASGTGAATFNLGTPPVGTAWVGTVAVPTAPVSAQFVLSVGGTAIAYFQGPNTSQQFQANGGQAITIAATGLAASTAYTAVFNGFAIPQEQAPNVFPGPTAFGSPAGLSVASTTISSGSSKVLLTAADGTAQYLIVSASITGTFKPNALPVAMEFYLSIDTPAGNNGFLYVSTPGQTSAVWSPSGNNASSFGGGLITPPGKNVYIAASSLDTGTITTFAGSGTIAYAQVAA